MAIGGRGEPSAGTSCEDAVIDYQFGTTDVFLVLPSERISTRYINFYGADASRHAA